MLRTIIVTDYDPEWTAIYAGLRARAAGALGDLALSIEHVGSTSVPGLAAKPVIDIDAVVPSPDDIPAAVDRLATIGYVHRGDLGITGRQAFAQPADLPKHHLYVCARGASELLRHLTFRDYLRAHPDAAGTYAALKRAAAVRFPNDIDSYIDAKTDFIKAVLALALQASRGD